ncbi:hypothetical protein D3C81_1740240 [compost metagenome]
MGFDFQWALAGDQAHAFLLAQQGNAFPGVCRQVLVGGEIDFVLALQVHRIAAVEQQTGPCDRADAFGCAEEDGRGGQVFGVRL